MPIRLYLIDCMPSLGMMTINALVSSDSVLIPVQAAYLPVKGLQQLIKTILTVKKRLNRKLAIEGILLTMVDFRTNYARDIASSTYNIRKPDKVFENVIPISVKQLRPVQREKVSTCTVERRKSAGGIYEIDTGGLNNEKIEVAKRLNLLVFDKNCLVVVNEECAMTIEISKIHPFKIIRSRCWMMKRCRTW